MSDLLETLRLAADDPMWADHAEVPKKLLRHTVDRIEALERENAALRDDDAKMQLLHRQEDQLIAAERKLIAASADKARLSEALRPFSEACDELDETDEDNCHIWEHPAALNINIADLRAARAALSGSNAGWRIEKMLEIISESFGLVQALHAEQPDQQEITRCQQNLISVLSYEDWTIPADADELERMLRPAAPQQGGE